MKVDDTDYANKDILQTGMKNSFIVDVMNDGFKIVLRVDFPHFYSKLVQCDEVDQQYDDKTEQVLDKDWLDVDGRKLVCS